MKTPYKVLFVCTGNICRSPTADAFLRHKVEVSGLSHMIEVDSCGTHGYHIGAAPDHRSIEVLKTRGIDMSYLRARKFAAADYNDFDLIIAMDEGHYSTLTSRAPQEMRAKISLFMDYKPEAGITSVPDPYYGGHEGFVEVLDLIEAGTEGLLEYILQETAA